MLVNYTELTALSTWVLASRQDRETSLIFGLSNSKKWQGCNGLNAIRAVLETGVPPRLTPINGTGGRYRTFKTTVHSRVAHLGRYASIKELVPVRGIEPRTFRV